jgi:hypothetical protein
MARFVSAVSYLPAVLALGFLAYFSAALMNDVIAATADQAAFGGLQDLIAIPFRLLLAGVPGTILGAYAIIVPSRFLARPWNLGAQVTVAVPSVLIVCALGVVSLVRGFSGASTGIDVFALLRRYDALPDFIRLALAALPAAFLCAYSAILPARRLTLRPILRNTIIGAAISGTVIAGAFAVLSVLEGPNGGNPTIDLFALDNSYGTLPEFTRFDIFALVLTYLPPMLGAFGGLAYFAHEDKLIDIR